MKKNKTKQNKTPFVLYFIYISLIPTTEEF